MARQAGGDPRRGRGDRGERRRRARRGGLSRRRRSGGARHLAAARRATPPRGRPGAPRRCDVRSARTCARARPAGLAPPRPRAPARELRLRPLRLPRAPPRAPTGRACGRSAGTSCRSSSRTRPGSRASPTSTAPSSRSPIRPRVSVAPTRFTRREVRELALEHERRLDRDAADVPAPRLRSRRRRRRGRVRPAGRVGGAAAGASQAGRMRLVAARRARSRRRRPRGCGRRRPRGVLRGRVHAEGGRSRPIRPPPGRTARLPHGCLREPCRLGGRRHRPGAAARDGEGGGRAQAGLSRPDRRRGVAGATASRTSCSSARRRCSRWSQRPSLVAELRRRTPAAPVDRLRRALRLVRESAGRAPPDRRRALDHLAATLGDVPPAARATRLAWSRPEPEPEPTLAVADEVAR